MSRSRKIVYKSMDQRSHVINRPDMYIGTTKNNKILTYVNGDDFKIVKKEIDSNSGLLRIFIEVLSNAIDNVWRSKEFGIQCTKIKIDIDQETGETSIWNDGLTIPVELNDQGIYNPEMIFGKLLTSSNYDDEEERKTSGRNGLGVKLTNIFSKKFIVSLYDTKTQKTYKQVWENNMLDRKEPTIKESDKKNGFTEIKWIPDFPKFGMTGYSDDIISQMKKYAIDATMITGVAIYLNGEKIPIKSLKDYAKLYYDTDEVVFMKTNDCDVVITPTTENDFDAISFVNGVETTEGGIHVDQWVNAIFRPILDKMNSNKKGPQLNIRDVKQFFRLFINATLVNPVFGSQDKSKLISPNVKADFPTKNLNMIMKWSVIEKIRDIIKSKELLTLKKTEKKKGFKKIDGFDPANNAGTKYSRDCTLILCEGLSAKTYAVMGIDVGAYGKKGRDWFGIYPLRGKILNVRNSNTTSISKNREVTDIIQALGIKYGVDYTKDENFDTLNYGKVMLLCDSDCDGLHISGLIMNLFHSLFPTLFDRKDPFIINMKTPLVRLYTKNEEIAFYSLEEYKHFIANNPDKKGRIKYFKGLGTSSDKEVRNSFGKRIVEYIKDEDTDENMNKVFHKKFADKRKKWLEDYDSESILVDDEQSNVSSMIISDFIDHEMIKFSIDDCKRSIPNIIDGLKESHRKILYATFLKGLRFTGKTMKVAQLSGFVAEKTNYHHGEQCLFDTITKLAHDFPGSNNIPLLFRDGQFGTRLSGGKDAASARYIFTKLDTLTRLLFREEDDVLLERVIDDGDVVEPVNYVPILPLILINGCIAGIGTGWSSSIPCFNPIDLIECVKKWMDAHKDEKDENKSEEKIVQYPVIKPWYRKFKGKIEENGQNKYTSYGILRDDGNKAVVSELPIGLWTDNFKEYVEELIEEKQLKSYKNYSTPDTINFTITEHRDGIKCNIDNLKLKSQISTSNMVLFSSENKIKKYDTVYDIINEFCKVRFQYYVKRKKYILSKLELELKFLTNKARFINEVMDEKIVLNRRNEEDIVKDLEEMKYHKFTPKDNGSDNDIAKSYRYLLDMKIRSFSKQKVDELNIEIEKLKNKLEEYLNKTEKDMWLSDLNEFETNYKKWV